MKASFVIVNYNRKEEILITIAKTLAFIEHINDQFEIIVVDNASTDGSAEAIKVQFPLVTLIESKVNIGAQGWNLGFLEAKGEYFIILDDDSHLEYGLEEALIYTDQNNDVGVLALNIVGGSYQTEGWKDLSDLIGFIGCGAIIRRKLYEQIGGFSEWIFIYTHEYEYGIRCLEAGYKLKYFEKCRVTHRASTINRTNRRLKVYSVRNEMAIVYKYFDKKSRGLYVARVYLNNLKGIYKFGPASIVWFYDALKEYQKLKKEIRHTPVKMEVEKIYRENFWSTKPFLGII